MYGVRHIVTEIQIMSDATVTRDLLYALYNKQDNTHHNLYAYQLWNTGWNEKWHTKRG